MAKKVYVAMSGGVDSSVAAALLKRQGFAVTGVFMKNWTQPINQRGQLYCPWREDFDSARAAARHLGIPLKIYNFELDYHDKVVNYFFREYAAGRTPNPDVMCNREIKFGAFLKRALEDGADYIATGHYVRRRLVKPANQPTSKPAYQLLRGLDPNKDQSYFLWAIKRDVVPYCLFPIGDYRKSEVRQLAETLRLPNAQRKDSQGICFIGPVSVREFLKEVLPERVGQVRTVSGEIVGSHEGVEFVTIGQRHGVGVATGQPIYVAEKDLQTNTVWVDEDWPGSRIYSSSAVISNVNWFDPVTWHQLTSQPASQQTSIPISVQARYRQEPVKATVIGRRTEHVTTDQLTSAEQRLLVRFSEPVRAVTEGQSLVCYNGDRVLGGGVIEQRGQLLRCT